MTEIVVTIYPPDYDFDNPPPNVEYVLRQNKQPLVRCLQCGQTVVVRRDGCISEHRWPVRIRYRRCSFSEELAKFRGWDGLQ